MKYTESLFAEQGTHHYTLSEESLSITGKGVDITLHLKGLEPDYEIVQRRSPAFYVGVIGAVLATLLALLTVAGFPVADSVEFPLMLAAIIAVISLLILVSASGKVVRARFKSTMGLDAIEIARSGPDILRFENFIDEISRRIRRSGAHHVQEE
jgi:hypothetical protein